MNKYDEAAREFPFPKCFEENGTLSTVPCVQGVVGLADAFRWFDARREKETCEYTPTFTSGGMVYEWVGTCGEAIEQWHSKYCGGCGRRIVEKEA